MCRADDADNDYMPRTECRPVAAWPHRCDDCGRTIPAGERFTLTEWAEWWDAERVDEDLALPVDHQDRRWLEEAGVRRGLRTRPFFLSDTWSDDYEVVFKPGTEKTDVVCDHCIAITRWLRHVCNTWISAEAVEDLEEHWSEEGNNGLYRCVALGRLILSARGRPDRQGMVNEPRVQPWHRLDGTLIPLATVERWVTEAIDAYERNTARMMRDLFNEKVA